MFPKRCFEIARLPFKVLYLGKGVQLDVQMPADLDQFRRKDSHGAVIGGKRLVQCAHQAADGWALFHQVNMIA
jgi:hypothetical protein